MEKAREAAQNGANIVVLPVSSHCCKCALSIRHLVAPRVLQQSVWLPVLQGVCRGGIYQQRLVCLDLVSSPDPFLRARFTHAQNVRVGRLAWTRGWGVMQSSLSGRQRVWHLPSWRFRELCVHVVISVCVCACTCHCVCV